MMTYLGLYHLGSAVAKLYNGPPSAPGARQGAFDQASKVSIAEPLSRTTANG